MANTGFSVIITADQHNATRRAKKAAQRRNRSTGGGQRAEGSDILALTRQDRAEAAHLEFMLQVAAALDAECLIGTNAQTTKVINLTVEAFLVEFDTALPEAYKSLGQTRTHYACDQTREVLRGRYGQRYNNFIGTTLAMCRRAVATVSRERNSAISR